MREERRTQKEYTEGISVKQSKFLSWFDNYWYHYKWITIGVAFFLIIVIVCTVQMCTKEEDDLTVVYAGRNTLSLNEESNLSRVLSSVAPSDFDENGEKNISVITYSILSESQVLEIQSQTDEDGNHLYVDKNFNSKEYETYSNYIMTGESSVLFLEPWLFEKLVAAGRVARVEDVIGYVPESAYGEYGVRLGDTAIYKAYGVMQLLPEDTVICILQPYVAGNSSKKEYYARETEMFEAIVTFEEEE